MFSTILNNFVPASAPAPDATAVAEAHQSHPPHPTPPPQTVFHESCLGEATVVTPARTLCVLPARALCALFDSHNASQLLFHTEAGDIQRHLDTEHLHELQMYQNTHFQRHGHYVFSNEVVVAVYDGKHALVDGQHRLEVLRYLLVVNPTHAAHVRVPVLVVQLRSVNEYDDIFVEVNKNKPVRLYHNVQDWKTVLKHVEDHFQNHYRAYLRTTNHPQVPHVNLDSLLRYLDEGNYVQRLGLGFEALKTEMETLNTFYRCHWREAIPRKYITNVATWVDKCEDKQPHRPLYLGMYRQFEWVDRILHKVTHNREHPDHPIDYATMTHAPIQYRPRISRTLRRRVWHKRHTSLDNGVCYTCARALDYDAFDCGHVTAVFYGGKTCVDNLEPVCHACNVDMGVENLEVFRERLQGGGEE